MNVTLGTRKTDRGGGGYRVGVKPHESGSTTIDFLPSTDLRAVRTRAISEEIIVAMFLNNRAVEALARDQVDDAYWWAREAVARTPGFLMPYNTLGAIYRCHGNPQEAEQVLSHVLDREPRNTQAMSNLIPVLYDLGRVERAQRLAARLEELEPDPLFSHFNRGMAAMRAGDPQIAKDEFVREVARVPDCHEFHFWLGITYLNLGEIKPARAHLKLAMQNSTTRRDHDLYAAKLVRINELH